MHRFRYRPAAALLALGLSALACRAEPLSLAQAFERAWERQPAARALSQRRDADQALRQAASAWTPEPAALETSLRSDRFDARQGARELELGVALPLWLPGERGRSQALADAQARSTEAQALAAQWQLAQTLRDAWWGLQREREEQLASEARWRAGQALALDVARRVQAGDLSRADQHQADASVAAARAEAALAAARASASEQSLRALLGLAPDAPLQLAADAEAEPGANDAMHPALAALDARADSAAKAAALAAVQSRANPELTLLQTRDRGARGEASQRTLTLGLRFPLGRSDRQRAAAANAAAERIEAELGAARERERVQAEQLGARAALDAARTVLAAAGERARLAGETRDFFDKSFRLGQTDLPTRLRVELEAANAERDLRLARIALQQAIATLRQALGLLPGQP